MPAEESASPLPDGGPAPSPMTARVEALKAQPRLGSRIQHHVYLAGQEARTAPLSPPLPASVEGALEALGVSPLWDHQTAGLRAVREGANVLVTTPTASGKSLIFQLPILEEAANGGPGRALFLYPLKALGQDQKARFEELASLAEVDASCEIYDGDTPKHRRAKIRQDPPRVLISNPDMIHLGMLPYWNSWQPFLRDLRWIVLDELHTYRGIFGSHFHHVLRRLLRLCHQVGSNPRIIASSATAANAEVFAERLCGEQFEWIRDSGAPREGRHFLLLQPDASPYTLALHLLISLLQQGQRTIVFTKARGITELLYKWLQRQEPSLAPKVASYRAGFLPEERRRIEEDLFSGRLHGVISTSALELGIDVGGLDACILVGYPGSMIATWQRSGRAGRRGRESLTALIALPDALDQYLLQRPDELLERPLEQLIVDPSNEFVGCSHLVCAAAERPLEAVGDASYLSDQTETIRQLVGRGDLVANETGDRWTTSLNNPQRLVNLRGSGSSYGIVDTTVGRTIGTVDGIRTLRECHPGAIYLHAGRQYLVKELLEGDQRVLVEPVDVDYYTSALGEKQTRIVEILEERHEGWLSAWLGKVEVTERVIGYERKRILGQERLDAHRLDLPPVQFTTVGLWWAVKPTLERVLLESNRHFLGALHASEHAAISLFPLLAICDRGDIGGISIAPIA
ncbi:MAG: DEAD/DEAH box helicase, partial [Thermoanaerobaculia bacterium]|nr:DEAD/DEAH box helicase [Thermoanaerobaculia bacterium]